MKVYIIGDHKQSETIIDAIEKLKVINGVKPLSPLKVTGASIMEIQAKRLNMVMESDAVYVLNNWRVNLVARKELTHAMSAKKLLCYEEDSGLSKLKDFLRVTVL
jgi:hypothetical protein